MHEVSLIENVIAMAQREQARHAFSRIRVIRLKVGALGHAEPDALRFCFDAVASGTLAEGSRLEIEMAPGEGWCADCRSAVPLHERFGACPVCDGARVSMTCGDVVQLTEMEVE